MSTPFPNAHERTGLRALVRERADALRNVPRHARDTLRRADAALAEPAGETAAYDRMYPPYAAGHPFCETHPDEHPSAPAYCWQCERDALAARVREVEAIGEAIAAALNGEDVGDFMQSFPSVRIATDLRAERDRLAAELAVARTDLTAVKVEHAVLAEQRDRLAAENAALRLDVARLDGNWRAALEAERKLNAALDAAEQERDAAQAALTAMQAEVVEFQWLHDLASRIAAGPPPARDK